ncbi:hypothetical protein ES703_117836 [subsurface metagenome]
MAVDLFGQPGLPGGVVDVVLRVERIDFPVVPIVVERCPDLNLGDNVPFAGQLEEVLEPSPIFLVPLVQVVFAVELLERPDVALVPAGHCAAYVVAAYRL